MPANQRSNLPDYLVRPSGPLAPRIEFYPEANVELIRGQRCAIVFIMALWSGPARKVYPAFIQAVQEADPGGELQILVVDTDGIPDWYELPELREKLGGWGEVLAICNGKILAATGFGLQPEKYRLIASSLVDTCHHSQNSH
jgi:hypothetical protein